MKNNKLILSLLLIMIVFISLSSISATDSNLTADTNSSDVDVNTLSDNIDSSEVLTDTDSIYVSVNGSDTTGDGSSDNPYATIQMGVDSCQSGGTLTILDGTYNINTPISINKTLTITGDGNVVIDGGQSTSLLSLGSNAQLAVQNIIFANGHATNGGVADVTSVNKQTTFSSCSFINNTADNNGGVFYSAGNAFMGTFSASSCLFLNNYAKQGGVFFGYGMMALGLSNCALVNNTDKPYYTNNGRFVTINNNYWGTDNPRSNYLVDDNIGNMEVSTWYLPVLSFDYDEITADSTASVCVRFVNNAGKTLSTSVTIPSVEVILNATNGAISPDTGNLSGRNVTSTFTPASTGIATITASIFGFHNLTGSITVKPTPLYASADAIDGSGNGSYDNPYTLEEAINVLNSDSGYTTIILLDGVYNPSSMLNISVDSVIKAYEKANVTISGSNSHGIFNILSNVSVEFDNISFVNGSGLNGGAIYLDSNSSLTANSCAFINNTATNGGAIYVNNDSKANITYSQIVNNNDYGIYAVDSANVTADNNWWGQNQGPNADNMYYGNVFVNSWLIVNLETTKTVLRPSWSDSITVKLLNNDNTTITGYVKDLNIIFTVENAVLIEDEGKLSYDNNYTFTNTILRPTDEVTGSAVIDNETLNISYDYYVPLNEVYVAVNGSDETGDGSINNPFATVSEALKYANQVNSTIYLLEGVYKLNLTDISDMNVTITSYDGDVYLDRTDSFRVFNVANTSNVVIKNLNFINGNAEHYPGDIYGAICIRGNATVENCTFSNGTCVNWGLDISNQKGIAYINNCTFEDNKASGTQCSAVFSNGKIYITNCRFLNNGLKPDGATTNFGETGIRILNDEGYVENCTFNNSYGSVALVYLYGKCTFVNCNFTNIKNNYAIDVQSRNTVLNVYNSTFINNDGAIGSNMPGYLRENVMYIDNCTFINNTGSDGGAIYSKLADFQVYNSTFINNSATNGGAIYGYYCAMDVMNCTFINNSATEKGGSIYTEGSDDVVTIGDNNFTNSSADIGGVIYSNGITTLYGNRMFDPKANNGSYIFNDLRVGNTYLKILDNETKTTKRGNFIIYATLTDDRGNPITGGNVTLTVDGQNYTSYLNEGRVEVTHYFDEIGQYTVDGNYSSSRRYITVVSNGTVNVIGGGYLSTVLDTPNIVKYYKNGTQFVAYLKDVNGNPLANKSLEFDFGFKSYYRTTDSEGKATFTINLNVGNYSVLVKFSGDNDYLASNSTGIVSVINMPVVLNASNLTMNYKDGSKYEVLLTDIDGNPLANKVLTLAITGVYYSATTDSNGVARLNINLKEGTYTIVAYFNEENYGVGNTSSFVRVIDSNRIPTQLITSDFRTAAGAGNNFTARLVDVNNLPVAGKIVKIVLGSKTYTRTTDSNGQIFLPIRLSQSIWNIGIKFDGDDAYAPSTNTAVITAVDSDKTKTLSQIMVLTRKVTKGEYFRVCLRDEYGQVMAGQKVKFTISTKTYTATTDSNGIAKLKINLKQGTYKIVTAFTGTDNYYSARSTSTNLKVV